MASKSDSGKGSGRSAARQYWRSNQIVICCLLGVWFLVSFVFAIFLAETLYEARIGALPASFWWAQQGSMFVFVILIFAYAFWMDRLDRRYGSQEDADLREDAERLGEERREDEPA